MELSEFLEQPALAKARGLHALGERMAKAHLEELYRATVHDKARMGLKYLDLTRQHLRCDRIVRALGLDTRAPLRLLDLGAGPGQFCFAAKVYGHDAIALERPFAETFDASIAYKPLLEFYGIPVSQQVIRPRKSLVIDQPLQGKFDRITALGIMFNIQGELDDKGAYWGSDDYVFFLEDLKENFLRPGGLVTLHFHGNLFGEPLAGQAEPVARYYSELGKLLEHLVVDFLSGRVAPYVTLDLSRMSGWQPTAFPAQKLL